MPRCAPWRGLFGAAVSPVYVFTFCSDIAPYRPDFRGFGVRATKKRGSVPPPFVSDPLQGPFFASTRPPLCIMAIVTPLTQCAQIQQACSFGPVIVPVCASQDHARPRDRMGLVIFRPAPLAPIAGPIEANEAGSGFPVRRIAGPVFGSNRHSLPPDHYRQKDTIPVRATA